MLSPAVAGLADWGAARTWGFAALHPRLYAVARDCGLNTLDLADGDLHSDMRAYLPEFELVSPPSLNDALELLSSEGEWRPFAGGTDLMVLLEANKLEHKRYFSLWHLEELRGIDIDDDYVTLGALTSYSQIQQNAVLRDEFPMLCNAARETGSIAIQNRGTIGGNIMNASPAADSPPALIAYDAELELVSSVGSRYVAYEGFHTGYKQMNIRADELLKSVRLPRTKKNWVQYYRKVGTRKAQAISKTCLAAAALVEDERVTDLRIVFGSVAPTVVQCIKTENIVRGQPIDSSTILLAREELAREIIPIDDIRSTSRYRLRVSQNLLEEFLLGLTK
jgi:CO/xanthine dehydrogenase FAD-binding subunit